MARSKPPVTIKLDKKAMDEANKIDEELAYFFTWKMLLILLKYIKNKMSVYKNEKKLIFFIILHILIYGLLIHVWIIFISIYYAINKLNT